MDEVEFAWFVGLFEGEGHCSVTKVKGRGARYPGLVIRMTDEDILLRVQSIVGGSVTGPHKSVTPSGKSGKPMYRWTLTSTEAVLDLCHRMLPRLGKRRVEQMENVINLQAYGTPVSREERFLSHLKYDKDCIIWTGHTDKFGFGSFCVEKGSKRKQAHRYAFEIAGLRCPKRLKNLCGNKACVNTAHWFGNAVDES